MKAVWKKLEPAFKGRENDVVDWIIFAYEGALRLLPPLPRTRAEFDEHLKRHTLVPASAEGNATIARHLLEQMRETECISRDLWEKLWPGDPTHRFEEVTGLIQHVAQFYERLNGTMMALYTTMDLPPPPSNLGATNVRERYFMSIMTSYFARQCGQKLFGVVADLADAVFDLKGEITEGAARSSHRQAVAKLNRIRS
jgi:hypothetical protein